MEVKTEADIDDVTGCSLDDKPVTGVFGSVHLCLLYLFSSFDTLYLCVKSFYFPYLFFLLIFCLTGHFFYSYFRLN